MTSASSPSSESSWIVATAEQGLPLLRYLQMQLAKTHSAKSIKRHIESKGCQVNGRIERFAARQLWAGDCVIWCNLASTPPSVTPVLKIVYEDEAILVIDKPVGLVSESKAIDNYLQRHSPLTLVHRLDRDTSGLLLLAKNQVVKQQLIASFQKRTIAKAYLALTAQSPHQSQGVVCNYMLPKGSYSGQTYWGSCQDPTKNALYAETAWCTLASSSAVTLIECRPKTGRTHQIRVHLSSLGCPIIGDSQYNKGRSSTLASRCLLHAWKLSFSHPSTHQTLHLTVPPPKDWLDCWQALSAGAKLPTIVISSA